MHIAISAPFFSASISGHEHGRRLESYMVCGQPTKTNTALHHHCLVQFTTAHSDMHYRQQRRQLHCNGGTRHPCFAVSNQMMWWMTYNSILSIGYSLLFGSPCGGTEGTHPAGAYRKYLREYRMLPLVLAILRQYLREYRDALAKDHIRQTVRRVRVAVVF